MTGGGGTENKFNLATHLPIPDPFLLPFNPNRECVSPRKPQNYITKLFLSKKTSGMFLTVGYWQQSCKYGSQKLPSP